MQDWNAGLNHRDRKRKPENAAGPENGGRTAESSWLLNIITRQIMLYVYCAVEICHIVWLWYENTVAVIRMCQTTLYIRTWMKACCFTTEIYRKNNRTMLVQCWIRACVKESLSTQCKRVTVHSRLLLLTDVIHYLDTSVAYRRTHLLRRHFNCQ